MSFSMLLVQLFLCVIGLFLGLRWGNYAGGVTYIVLGGIASNIQVLKIVPFPWFCGETFHMAQGTLVFCSLFWAQDIITEVYGPKHALRVTFMSMGANVLFSAWMLTTYAMPTSTFEQNHTVQQAFETLFVPSPRLFAASLIAYFCSQALDIFLFSAMKQQTRGAFLGLRALLSTVLASFLDHFLFSWIAFQLLDPNPLPWTLWCETYLFTGFGLRMLLALFSPVTVFFGCRMLRGGSN